jgi:NADH-ubiquinone oxidoreductase chain 6
LVQFQVTTFSSFFLINILTPNRSVSYPLQDKITKGLKNSKALGEPYKLPLFPPLLPQNASEHLFLRYKTKKRTSIATTIMGVYGQEIGSRHYSLHSIVLLIDTVLYLAVMLLYNSLSRTSHGGKNITYTIQREKSELGVTEQIYIMNHFLLDVLAFGAVLSGILVITAKNPVISVLFLISVFINVAGYLVLLGVAYLGLAYLIIYVGAIAILFLFVIMMLNLRLVELIDTGQEYTQNLPLGAIIGALFFFELLSILPFSLFTADGSAAQSGLFNLPAFLEQGLGLFSFVNSLVLGIDTAAPSMSNVHVTFNPVVADNNFTSFLQIESIGQGLYTYASLWLIVASVIFLLAMVGPIVLCMSSSSRSEV